MTDDDLPRGARTTPPTRCARALDGLDDWGLAGTRSGQYRATSPPTRRASRCSTRAGLGGLSEESGVAPRRARRSSSSSTRSTARPTPVAASRGTPPACARSTPTGPRAALVVDQASGRRFRGRPRRRSARSTARPLAPIGCHRAAASRSSACPGYPPRYLGWKQFRALGAAALDLCAVAEGVLDGYVDCSPSAHGSWDYLGGMLVCHEAGVPGGRRLRPRPRRRSSHADRRTRSPAATPELLGQLGRRAVDRSRGRMTRRSPVGARTRSRPPVGSAGGPASSTAAPCRCTSTCPVRCPSAGRAPDGAVVHRRRDVHHRARRRRAPARPPLLPRRGGACPGGLLKRGEDVRGRLPGARCTRRSASMVELLGEPAVVVDAEPQRVDVVFRCRPADGADPDAGTAPLARDRRGAVVPPPTRCPSCSSRPPAPS